jgi:CO/xanthine dehydrogenase Mo-binding subunit
MHDASSPRRYVGQPMRRREDYKFVTGQGRYVDDINVPGTLHAAVLRSPHAHASITAMKLAAARASAGVTWFWRALTSSGRSDPSSRIGLFPEHGYPIVR